VALGAQYKATDKLSLMGGYLYNMNPVRAETTLFNVQAPGIITNTLSLGASYNITEDITASLAWVHGFRNSSEGSILQLPGSTVRLDAQLDTIWMGVNIRFGRGKRKSQAEVPSALVYETPADPTSNTFMPQDSPPARDIAYGADIAGNSAASADRAPARGAAEADAP
jgi:hypothetical protein